MRKKRGEKLTQKFFKVKQYKQPSISAKKLVDAADQLQSDDNTTAVVSLLLISSLLLLSILICLYTIGGSSKRLGQKNA